MQLAYDIFHRLLAVLLGDLLIKYVTTEWQYFISPDLVRVSNTRYFTIVFEAGLGIRMLRSPRQVLYAFFISFFYNAIPQ